METIRSSPEGIWGKTAYFFRQTFRRHTGAEYAELLTRGMRGTKGVNRKYPWAYLRMFTLVVILFAIFLLIVRFTSNELFAPTITVLASVCCNLSMLLLLYELYPERDLSFMAVCLAMLLGGAGANIISQILFNLFPSPNLWLKAVYSGFFEELPKAAATIAAIIIVRRRSPLAGFIMGAAVGCGFSIVEDMGYIFLQSNQIPTMNLTTIITVAASRGASSLCTHILWTAAVGWAYSHFDRHFANVVFYFILIVSCGLHICWDLPLDAVALGFVYAGCAFVAILECTLILHFERKKVYRAEAVALLTAGVHLTDGEIYYEEDARSLNTSDPEYWGHWGRLTIVLGAFLMAVVAIIYCSIPFRETYGMERFSSPAQLVEFMQEGLPLDAKDDRKYDSSDRENDGVSGEYVTQYERETVEWNGAPCEVVYEYMYNGSYDTVSGKSYYYLYKVSAKVVTSQGENTYVKETLYNEGETYASFFRLRTDVTGFNFGSDGSVTAFVYNPAFVRDLSEPRYVALFCTFAGIFGASAVCFMSLKIKGWKVKKITETKKLEEE